MPEIPSDEEHIKHHRSTHQAVCNILGLKPEKKHDWCFQTELLSTFIYQGPTDLKKVKKRREVFHIFQGAKLNTKLPGGCVHVNLPC